MSNLTDTKQELLDCMEKLYETFTPGYLAMLAISGIEPPAGYSRGDFKRGIRVLRELQRSARLPAEVEIEDAISLIRREWLRRPAYEN